MRNVRGEQLLRTLHGVLPLGRHYQWLLGALNSDQGLLVIPFESFRFVIPATWRKLATNFLLTGPNLMPEFRLLKPIIQNLRTGCLVDVGANMGLYTMFMRSNSTLPIVAYEPQPFLCDLARRSVALNHFADIEVRNVGCGAERGELPFHNNPNGSVAVGIDASSVAACPLSVPMDWEAQAHRLYCSDTITKIPITTLDEDLADKPSIALLKIDCEGFEYQILQGAQQLLKRHRPLLFVEVHPEQIVQFGHSTRELLKLISPDYELEFWYFQIGRHASRFRRSLEKFRRPKARRCATVEEMLAASTSVPGPAQIYFIGRSKGTS
ncbi:MAG: FkbM family methyltransferase [Verrucomicrobiota bacterium]|jgi:FkbM family methyltransferase